ncbi:MAG: nuclear transport factor 2 family protein [Castellaniella sp.]|nr:MAG: nuclear transport factor 2 family protein [Castellaniella sp.]
MGSAAIAATLIAGAVQAAPMDEARTHFQAIASGDVAAIMHGYADQTQFLWVGGPLDGTYSTHESIQGVWGKFAKSQGPLKLTVDDIEQAANPKGATVSANVLFKGKADIKVRYILTYRNDKIVNEVWQIDPKLKVAAH